MHSTDRHSLVRCGRINLIFVISLILMTDGLVAKEWSTSDIEHRKSHSGLIQDWQGITQNLAGQNLDDQIQGVNYFFNRRVRYATDIETWGMSDYWATPLETLSQAQGDCEDFAIAKFFTLLKLGIPEDQLRLIYTVVAYADQNIPKPRAHLVVTVYPQHHAPPMILDNLTDEILPIASRNDLRPLFSFNRRGLWQGSGDLASPSRYRKWSQLVTRTKAEHFLTSGPSRRHQRRPSNIPKFHGISWSAITVRRPQIERYPTPAQPDHRFQGKVQAWCNRQPQKGYSTNLHTCLKRRR